jgi:hypothetical protein
MKIKIILFLSLLLNATVCFAEEIKTSFKELNLYTLNAINIINDYQKGLSQNEMMKSKSSWEREDAKLWYDFLSEKGIEEAFFKAFSNYILVVGQHLDLKDVSNTHDGKCGWALICRFATIKRIKDGLTLDQIKSMSYPEIESEIDSLFYIAKNASIRRAFEVTAQSFSNCVALSK